MGIIVYRLAWATKPNTHSINIGLVKKAYLTIGIDDSIIADINANLNQLANIQLGLAQSYDIHLAYTRWRLGVFI
ncbi:TPA: hypothetical protein ENS27_05655 [bacterium]|nr:hypothetical protein [bacterium]